MPFSASSLRIWSARRKVAMLLGLGALGNQSIDGLVGERLAGKQFGSHVVQAAGAARPTRRRGGWARRRGPRSRRKLNRNPTSTPRTASRSPAKNFPWSMAVLENRSRSKIGARASAVFRSLARAVIYSKCAVFAVICRSSFSPAAKLPSSGADERCAAGRSRWWLR